MHLTLRARLEGCLSSSAPMTDHNLPGPQLEYWLSLLKIITIVS